MKKTRFTEMQIVTALKRQVNNETLEYQVINTH
ncbi:hypothetical protein SAMN05444410_10821 [Hydrobacter penzbergensis]|uniref:Uncharacterized protein n=1 Tax=Hydrobacter penzbergensis TaxID=1235997 RepID=A0A8X8LEJ0_9BACT|nr:hypothetical protein SAMN05444410_10821 [Hydrobacter penzbergensis]